MKPRPAFYPPLVGGIGALLAAAMVLVACFTGCASRPTLTQPVELTEMELAKQLEKLASQIPFIMPSDVIYQRAPYGARENLGLMDDRERAALKAFMALADTANESTVWKLTAHSNARIRTLAMICAYWQGNPARLPGLYELCADSAKTFPALGSTGAGGGPAANTIEERRRKVGLLEQTVGDVAKRIVGTYLGASGNWTALVAPDAWQKQDFDTYWAQRKNRDACLSWFELSLRRATHGTTPFQSECTPALLKLRNKVSKLEPPYRGWITLALRASSTWGNEVDGPDYFASGAEIVSAAREIGTSTLMHLFKGQLESSDPDLRMYRYGPFGWGSACRLVLGHAHEIFGHEDSDTILALEDFHRSSTNREFALVHPCWAIAAADLAPAKAKEILLSAFERFKNDSTGREQDERCELAQAYWKHEQMAGVEVVKNWFYAETPEKTAFGFGRHRFAKWLADTRQRPLLQAIALDSRLDQLDWYTLYWLMRSANESAGREILSDEELDGIRTGPSDLIERVGREEAMRMEPDWVKSYLTTRTRVFEKLRAAFRE